MSAYIKLIFGTIILLLCFLIAFTVVVIKTSKDVRKRFLIKSLIILCICAFIEGVLLNLDSLSTMNLVEKEVDHDSIVVLNQKSVEIRDINTPCETITVCFSGTHEIVDVDIYISDDAYKHGYARANTIKICPDGYYNFGTAKLISNGNLNAIKLVWDNKDAALTSVSLDRRIPYNFVFIRFAIISLLLIVILAVREFNLWTIAWNKRSKNQSAILVIEILVLILMATWVDAMVQPYDTSKFIYTQEVEYPFIYPVSEMSANTHAVMFDSLFHGGVVQEIPTEEFKQIENPYDPTQRGGRGLFDYAYYNEHYYAYYGLSPVLVYYFPYYVLNGVLPSYTDAGLFFAVLTIIAGCLCFLSLLDLFNIKTSALAVFILVPTVIIGTHIYVSQASMQRYYLCFLSGICFLYFSLWCAANACCRNNRKFLWFCLAGVFSGLTVWSRPILALALAGWLIPLFISVVISKEYSIKNKALYALSYLTPLTLWLVVIMRFNYIRFGSVFEFGQYWQLTREDIHYNKVRLRDLLPATWYFFFDDLTFSGHFPFVTCRDTFINTTGNYFFKRMSAGVFSVPITWGLLGSFLNKKISKTAKCIFLSAGLLTVIIALLDFDIAGLTHRYTYDVLTTLCLISCIMLAYFCGAELDEKRSTMAFITASLSLVTVFIGIFLVFGNYSQYIAKYAPDIYLYYDRALSLY